MKRIVIKIGTSTITHKSGLLNFKKLDELSKVLSDLNHAGYEIILVSSGAIAAGKGKMHISKKPDTLEKNKH